MFSDRYEAEDAASFFVLTGSKNVMILSGFFANLISAKQIDEKTILDIEKEISANIKSSIKLKSKVDETLIGGVVIQIGSLMIDTSIKNKLEKYKKVMMEN